MGQLQKVGERCYLSHRPCEHSTNFKCFGIFTLASALRVLYIFVSGLGAGLSASRRAWERGSLHEPLETLNNHKSYKHEEDNLYFDSSGGCGSGR